MYFYAKSGFDTAENEPSRVLSICCVDCYYSALPAQATEDDVCDVRVVRDDFDPTRSTGSPFSTMPGGPAAAPLTPP